VEKKVGFGTNRVIVATVLLIITLACVWYGGIWIALYLGVFVYIGIKEFSNIAKSMGADPPFYYIVSAIFLLVALASFKKYEYIFPAFALITILAFIIILFSRKRAGINDIAMTILAITYCGILPIHMIMIRNIDAGNFLIFGNNISYGLGLIMLTFLIVPACDIGAYYSGKFFGKHHLWKEISPKKTIEGSIGGTLAGIAIALIVGTVIGLNIVHSLIIGFLLSVFGQLGDLSESMLKRQAGIKDSGSVFLSHGGVLDRSDSYIFTVVVAYYYYTFFII